MFGDFFGPFRFMGIFIGIAFVLIAGGIIAMIIYALKSNAKNTYKMPPQYPQAQQPQQFQQPQNTQQVNPQGTPSQQAGTLEKTFIRSTPQEEGLFAEINMWLQQHPSICNIRMYIHSETKMGLLVNQPDLSSVTILYSESSTVNYSYGFCVVSKLNLRKVSLEEMKQKWESENPQYKIVTSHWENNYRGDSSGPLFNNIGGSNQNTLYILYRVRT